MNQTELEKILYDIEIKRPFKNDSEKITAIKKIMYKENKKSLSKKNSELIDECIIALLTLEGIDVKKMKEEVEGGTDDRLKLLHERIKQNNNKRYYPKKSILITIIIVITMLLANQLVIVAFDFNPIIYMIEQGKEIINMISGDRMDIDGITFISMGETQEYESIEALVESENIEILYPVYLPDDTKLLSIEKLFDEKIIFNFSPNDLYISKSNEFDVDLNKIEDAVIYETEIAKIYIFKIPNKYQAVFHYNDEEYIICYSEYDILTQILDSMKVS